VSGRDALAVFVGGGIGAAWREALMLAVADLPGGFPMPIFIANMAAATIIGLVAGYMAAGGLVGGRAKLLVMTGFCGGLSTFSSFIWGTEQLLGDPAQRVTAIVYLVGSMVLGLALVWAGHMAGERMAERRSFAR
jgi:fluoride exporter